VSVLSCTPALLCVTASSTIACCAMRHQAMFTQFEANLNTFASLGRNVCH
jgi:hypothetical protein